VTIVSQNIFATLTNCI